jgi:hypothetical protein
MSSEVSLSLCLSLPRCLADSWSRIESFAKELKEDEEMVLKVLEARDGREERARVNAREVLVEATTVHNSSEIEIPIAEREAEARCLRTQATRCIDPSLSLLMI